MDIIDQIEFADQFDIIYNLKQFCKEHIDTEDPGTFKPYIFPVEGGEMFGFQFNKGLYRIKLGYVLHYITCLFTNEHNTWMVELIRDRDNSVKYLFASDITENWVNKFAHTRDEYEKLLKSLKP